MSDDDELARLRRQVKEQQRRQQAEIDDLRARVLGPKTLREGKASANRKLEAPREDPDLVRRRRRGKLAEGES